MRSMDSDGDGVIALMSTVYTIRLTYSAGGNVHWYVSRNGETVGKGHARSRRWATRQAKAFCRRDKYIRDWQRVMDTDVFEYEVK